MPGTNEIAVRLIFENSSQPKITKHELKKLFNFATSGTRFIFKWSNECGINGIFLRPCPSQFAYGLERNGWKNLTKKKLNKLHVDDIKFEN